MKAGQTKIFQKSGNKVRLIMISSPGEWVVERVDGRSAGKQMICRESALVDSIEQ